MSEDHISNKDTLFDLKLTLESPDEPFQFISKFTYKKETLSIYRSHYIGCSSCIAIVVYTETGEPYATVSEYHEGIERALVSNEFVVQTRNMNASFCEQLLATGVFEDTGRRLTFGPFETKEPIWRIKTIL